MSWSRRFEEPIELPDGRKLKTLAEAMAWPAKEIPKSEHKMEKMQTAAHCVTRAAEHGGMQAIHRHRERVFNPDRKDHQWEAEEGRMNHIGRLAIFAVLLIVALLIIWQVFGAAWG